MNSEIATSAMFEFPAGLSFEIPRDYAKFSEGKLVSVDSAADHVDGLRVTWDNKILSFQHARVLVQYRASSVVRLLLNLTEQLKGQTICTLRVLFKEEDGTMGALPVVSCGAESAGLIATLGNEVMSSTIPFDIEVFENDRR